MKTRLVVGDTFRTKGGLEMYVERREGSFYLCAHPGTKWFGWYREDGEYIRAYLHPDKNLHADFYVE